MKRRITLPLVASILFIVASASIVNAAAEVNIYGYPDKFEYLPGDSGSVKFWVFNGGPDTIVVKNVSIFYPWYSPIWDGNSTIKNIEPNFGYLEKDKNYSSSATFTVPNDARAQSGSITVTVVYTVGTSTQTRTRSIPMNVRTAPGYVAFQDMDRLVTLFTVGVVLMIVCTAIIAAAIFLSMRRPQVMWREEAK